MGDFRPGKIEPPTDTRPHEPQSGHGTGPLLVVRTEQQRRDDGGTDGTPGPPPSTVSRNVRLSHSGTQINATPSGKGVPQRALRRGQLLI
ncbi:hypothetical protein PV390_34865 [Streptomyces sp. ME02-6991-2A]|uniref:hypothetical protein n=1 Tax=Streptomyces sp. ME02-6991-2A TaxID=3028677 RepID=UPI00211B3CDF|nr:hypothetical protein [Streptomyces sp. ME02-6991-2A]MDX3379580.1 hypothetical protein [Streptomyces sp. ME02-6991-2A]